MNIDDIINKLPDKSKDYSTTSHKFKRDLYKFCVDNEIKSGCEFGSSSGYTTRVLSFCLETVYSVDLNFDKNKKLNNDRSNIRYIQHNLYHKYPIPIKEPIDLCLVDANHEFPNVCQDIDSALKLGVRYIVFDDYGLFRGVKSAVTKYLNDGRLELLGYIGQPGGYDFGKGRVLSHAEGVITKNTFL